MCAPSTTSLFCTCTFVRPGTVIRVRGEFCRCNLLLCRIFRFGGYILLLGRSDIEKTVLDSVVEILSVNFLYFEWWIGSVPQDGFSFLSVGLCVNLEGIDSVHVRAGLVILVKCGARVRICHRLHKFGRLTTECIIMARFLNVYGI
jgi:hypothetical protein